VLHLDCGFGQRRAESHRELAIPIVL
jgi:hypothetical protein